MGEVASAYVSLLPSAKGWGSQIDRQVGPQLDRSGRTSGTRFGRVFTKATIGPLRTFGGLAAGIFAAHEIKQFFGSAITEARESQKVSALTAQVIKSTGGAAQISAKQVAALTTAISNKVGIDDEAIQRGANLLLTFKGIRNEAGKGNDVFNQTTRVMTDMSAALGQDMKASAIQLGKALNDPVKGVTALQRVGVTFTDKQKATIASLVKSGKTMAAQKLILRELKSEFGGAAAASTTMGEKVGVAWSNIKEKIGTALLPLLDKVEKAILTKVFPAFSGIGGVISRDVVPALQAFGKFVTTSIIPAIQQFATKIGPGLKAAASTAFTFFKTDVLPVLQGLWSFITGKLAPAVGSILSAAFSAFSGAVRSIMGTIQAHRKELGDLLGAIRSIAGFLLKILVPVFKVALPIALRIAAVPIRLMISAISLAVKVFEKILGAGKAVGRFFSGPFIHGIGVMVSLFITGVKWLADAALKAFGVIIHGGASALGWVPGIGGKLKSAAKAFDKLKNNVDSSLSRMAASAKGWGVKTGEGLGTGFQVGIARESPAVIAAAHHLGWAAAKSASYGAQVTSPSKLTTYTGRMIAQGLTVGFKKEWPGVVKDIARQVSDGLSSSLKSSLSSAFERLDRITTDALSKQRDKIRNARSRIASLADTISGGGDLSSLFSTDDSGATTVGSLAASKAAEAAGLKQFAADIKKARRLHLNKITREEIAGLGFAQGDQVLRQIFGESGAIGSINASQKQIGALSSDAAASITAPHLDALTRSLDRLERRFGRIEERAVQRIEVSAEGPISPAYAREMVKALNKLGTNTAISVRRG